MDKLNVFRLYQKDVKYVKVGDKIFLPLYGLGTFVATAHKITGRTAIFIFDDYVVMQQMNKKPTNTEWFEGSDLKKWLNDKLLYMFPDYIIPYIGDITIPYAEELYSSDYIKSVLPDAHVYFEDIEQLPLMKNPRNRLATLKGEECIGWLRNTTNFDFSKESFICDYMGTGIRYANSTLPLGVRPKFTVYFD